MLPNAYADAARKNWKHANIEEYLPLVKKIAGRIAIALPPHVDEDDLIGHGVFGLLDAFEKFDPMRGVKFETYASLRIRGSILDGLRIMDWVPHSARQKVKRVHETFAILENNGRPATIDEVAATLNMDKQEIEEVLWQAQTLSLISFDEFSATEENSGFHNFIDNLIDNESEEAFLAIEEEENKKVLAEAIDKLPEKERLVIALYYQEELTLKEIAAVLNLSESRISQLHSKAITRLRGKFLRKKSLML